MAEATPKQTTLTRSSLATETVNGSYLFVIERYSAAKGRGVGKHLTSDEFTAGGYKWAIYFYPDGKSAEDNSNYVSLYIVLASKARNVRALFEVMTMDQSGKGKHKMHNNVDRALPYTLKCGGSLWGYKRYFKRDVLENSDYLRNDCLKIYCSVSVVIDRSMLFSIKVPDSDIGSHMGMLLENMEGCDITFNVSGEKLHAHKLILAARSTKFRAELLEGVGIEGGEVMVPDMEPNVFKALLHFIYRDALPENEQIASPSSSAPSVADTLSAKLLAAADRYDLKRLKRICESHLCKDISANSVTQVIALAEHCHAAELKDVCLKFAAENLSVVAGYDDDGKSGNVRGQLSDGGDSSGRMVEQRVEQQAAADINLAGCDDDGKSGNVRDQLSDGGEAQRSDGGDGSGRRVKQRVEQQAAADINLAVCDDDGKSGTVRGQLSDGGEAQLNDGGESSGQRVKPRVEQQEAADINLAGCDDDGKSGNVRGQLSVGGEAQFSDYGDNSGRRVKQRVELPPEADINC